MARRRRASIPAIDLTTRSKPGGPRDQMLGVGDRAVQQRVDSGRTVTPGSAAPYRAQTERTATPELQMAIEMAREGDDIILMPYQPTPTINAGRPRTRAIGYNAATRTMWIRFREPKTGVPGAVYEYYGVEPRHWKNIRRVDSPGKYINRQLQDKYEYARTDI